jgi:pilus assembly protein CpaB
VQGAQAKDATAGKVTHSVSLELAPEQVKKIAVAKDLGKLSLAIRSAVEQRDTVDGGTMFGCDVSQEIARQNAIASQSATVEVVAAGKAREYLVKKRDAADTSARLGCGASPEVARHSAALANLGGNEVKE